MFKGATLFAVVFILIAPKSRAFLAGVLTQTGDSLNAWAPFSYIALALFIAAPIASVLIVRSWPAREEPENPMAKYKREAPFEE
jgi:hypothetical protein